MTNRGILLTLGAILCLTIMAACIKAAERIPPGEAVFFRAFCALPVIVVWLLARQELRSGLSVQSWKGHAVRAIAGSMAMGLGFFGLKLIPLPEATAIRFATPILVVIFAVLILGEVIRLFRISAVLLGLVGVTVIMWPRLTFAADETATIGAIVTLVSAALAALAQVFVKSMAGTEKTTAIVFWFSGTASVLALCTLPFGWVWPTGQEWLLLIGAGLIGGLGQIMLTSSYKYADASTLAPFIYSSMIWSLIIGYFVFAEVPTFLMLAGAGLVIISGIAIVLRERALGIQKTAENKVQTVIKQG